MQKWEYKVINTAESVKRESLWKDRDPERVEAFLNKLGEQGWEIVTTSYNFVGLNSGEVGAFFALAKRPRQ